MQLQQTRIRELSMLEQSLRSKHKEKEKQLQTMQEQQKKVKSIMEALPNNPTNAYIPITDDQIQVWKDKHQPIVEESCDIENEEST